MVWLAVMVLVTLTGPVPVACGLAHCVTSAGHRPRQAGGQVVAGPA